MLTDDPKRPRGLIGWLIKRRISVVATTMMTTMMMVRGAVRISGAIPTSTLASMKYTILPRCVRNFSVAAALRGENEKDAK